MMTTAHFHFLFITVVLLAVIECSVTSPSEGVVEKRRVSVERLKSWAGSDETSVVNIAIEVSSDGNLGLRAIRNYTEDEVVLLLSKRFIITEDMLHPHKSRERNELTEILEKKQLGHQTDHFLLLYTLLLDFHDENSFFRPYYDALPQSLGHLPLYWSKEELDELGPGGHFVRKQVLVHNMFMDDAVLLLTEVDPRLAAVVSRNTIVRFWCLIFSRSFRLPGPSDRLAMIPLGDFFNHKAHNRDVILVERDDMIYFKTAHGRAQSGFEIFSSYGEKMNDVALFYYGFVMDNVELDTVGVMYEDPSARGPNMGGIGATGGSNSNVARDDSPRKKYLIQLQMSKDKHAESLAVLRNLVMSSGGVSPSDVISTSHSDSHDDTSWGRLVEKKMLLKLAKMCQHQLKLYPTTLASDLSLLQQQSANASAPPMSNNMKNAVQLRVGEKRVVNHYLALATTALRLLTAPSGVAASGVLSNCMCECHEMTRVYLISTVLPLLPFAVESWDDNNIDLYNCPILRD